MLSFLDVISQKKYDDKLTHRFFSQDHTAKKLIFQAFHSHREVDNRSTGTNLFMNQTIHEAVRYATTLLSDTVYALLANGFQLNLFGIPLIQPRHSLNLQLNKDVRKAYINS